MRLKTKLRLYSSNVNSVLLHGSECWTATPAHMLKTFQNICRQRILGVFCPNIITNKELHCKLDTISLTTQTKGRRWRWLGHVCRMSPDTLPKAALLDGRWEQDTWSTEKTRRGTIETEMKDCGLTWNIITMIPR